MLIEGIRRLPVIEDLLQTLTTALEPGLADVHCVHEIVDIQPQQVTYDEQMLQRVNQRSAVLERGFLTCKAKLMTQCAPSLMPTRTVGRSHRPATRYPEAPNLATKVPLPPACGRLTLYTQPHKGHI